jgi:hypothetical protein
VWLLPERYACTTRSTTASATVLHTNDETSCSSNFEGQLECVAVRCLSILYTVNNICNVCHGLRTVWYAEPRRAMSIASMHIYTPRRQCHSSTVVYAHHRCSISRSLAHVALPACAYHSLFIPHFADGPTSPAAYLSHSSTSTADHAGRLARARVGRPSWEQLSEPSTQHDQALC